MGLNQEAAFAAHLAFDRAWAKFDSTPTVLQRMGALNEALEAYEQARSGKCTYPACNCPFDAPSDPNWCARGLPK